MEKDLSANEVFPVRGCFVYQVGISTKIINNELNKTMMGIEKPTLVAQGGNKIDRFGGDPPTINTAQLNKLRGILAERMHFEKGVIEHLESVGVVLPKNPESQEDAQKYEEDVQNYMHSYALKEDKWLTSLSPEMRDRLFKIRSQQENIGDVRAMEDLIHGGVKTDIQLENTEKRAKTLAAKNVEVMEKNLHLAKRALDLEEEKKRFGLDALTGLHTRGSFETELARRNKAANLDRADLRKEKHEDKYWLFYIDIDHFKLVNDTYGHPAGDAVIQSVAKTIKDAVRADDFVARIGGEEIAVIAPDGDMDVIGVADRIRSAVESKPIQANDHDRIRVTISVGVAAFAGDVTKHIKMADAALQAAKGNTKAANKLVEEMGITVMDPMPDAKNSRNQVWCVANGEMHEYKKGEEKK